MLQVIGEREGAMPAWGQEGSWGLGVAFLPGLASWSCFTPLPVSRRACLEQQVSGCPRCAVVAPGPLGKGTNPIPVLPCPCPLLGGCGKPPHRGREPRLGLL